MVEIRRAIVLSAIVAVLVALVQLPSLAWATKSDSGLEPVQLRCEYRVDPLGIDVTRPRLGWQFKVDDNPARRSQKQTAYQVLVADSEESLRADKGNLWDSGRINSEETIHVAYGGKPLTSRSRCFWKVRVWDQEDKPSPWSRPAMWSMGLLDGADWQARWIAATETVTKTNPLTPVPMFRKEFVVSAPIRRATAYVTALGCYEMWMNGRRVGDEMLTPQWTDYNKRVLYQTFDVTGLIHEGPNAVGALVADGWYRMRTMYAPMTVSGQYYGDGIKRLLAQIEVEHVDGTMQTLVTDGTWKCTVNGPWRMASMYDGVTYDARKEAVCWDRPGFSETTWLPVHVKLPAWPLTISAQPSEPIRILRELKPVHIAEPKPGVYVFDLGQNIAGYCRVRLEGPAGTTVRLRHAQMVGPDGMLYTANLGVNNYNANVVEVNKATDTFVLKGGGPQMFQPTLMYHGFRYVELTGLPSKPVSDCLTGLAIDSTTQVIGSLESSDPVLTKLWQNIVWTYRGNMPSVVTDCAARNERYGWLGDGESSWQSICFAMDVGGFGTKWVRDIHDEQEANGLFSITAPKHDLKNMSAPAWSDAGVIIPWTSYVNLGDRRLMELSYEPARRYVEAILRDNPGYLWTKSRGNDYSDWLDAVMVSSPQSWAGARTPDQPVTPKELFATAFLANSTAMVAKMAAALGKKDEATRYHELARKITDAFVAAYVDDQGRIRGNTQACYAIPLEMGLLDGLREKRAVEHLLAAVQTHDGKFSTGIHSTKRLLLALSARGHHDLAYALVMNPQFPSYRYMIDCDATTVWERFDGWRKDLGFNPDIMNDFSHVGLSGVGEWIWRMIVGLNPDENQPGYKHFVIHPRPGAGLSFIKAQYDSIRGTIGVEWKIDRDKFTLNARIPPNTTATIYLPSASQNKITESGMPVVQANGVRFLRIEEGCAV